MKKGGGLVVWLVDEVALGVCDVAYYVLAEKEDDRQDVPHRCQGGLVPHVSCFPFAAAISRKQQLENVTRQMNDYE